MAFGKHSLLERGCCVEGPPSWGRSGQGQGLHGGQVLDSGQVGGADECSALHVEREPGRPCTSQGQAL